MNFLKKPEAIIGIVIVLAAIAGTILYLKAPQASQSSDSYVTDTSGATTTDSSDGTTTAFGLGDASKPASKPTGKPAPEITDPAGFVNTGGQPITFSQFKGKKVVLVDIWTYSCINCQRTIPYVKAWYDKYSSQGLEIIGIHTPEFSFEKLQSNVEDAVKRFGILYPVVLDNNYGTWNAFGNQFWPRKYLIDINGNIVYDHAGEGDYDVTEKAIQKALAARDTQLGLPVPAATPVVNPSNAVSVDSLLLGSPETYFGAARNQYLANGSQNILGMQTLALPASFQQDALYLGGAWNFLDEYAESKGETKIVYQFQAKNVYFVASAAKAMGIKILLDGKAPGAMAGADATADGAVTIGESRLYHLVAEPTYGIHTLEIDIPAAGLDAFTFTFG